MKNGDLDSKGFLASIIRAEGTIESFKVWLFFNMNCSFELMDIEVSGKISAMSSGG